MQSGAGPRSTLLCTPGGRARCDWAVAGEYIWTNKIKCRDPGSPTSLPAGLIMKNEAQLRSQPDRPAVFVVELYTRHAELESLFRQFPYYY